MGKSDTPENRVKTEVLKYLKLRQIKAWSNPSGAMQIRPGKFMSFGKMGKESTGYKWPIKIMRTKNFITEKIEPVDPLYEVLWSRKIIFPFQSTMKDKEWAGLPFEDGKGIKPTAI
jgi:hypothetical protein